MTERFSGDQSLSMPVERVWEMTRGNLPSITYLAGFEPPPGVFDNLDWAHDGRHAAATQITGSHLMATREYKDVFSYQPNCDLRSVMNHAFVLHDIGRSLQEAGEDEGMHGIRGSVMVRELLGGRLTQAELHILSELVKGHAPGGTFDPRLDIRLLRLMKHADKAQLVRVEREMPGVIDRSQLPPLTEEVFFPICEALYSRVDVIAEQHGLSGYMAMLMAGVELGIVRSK